MMGPLQLFITAFIVGFSGAMMPGPLLTVTIGESARRGVAAAPLIVLGHIILELLLVILLVAGLAAVFNSGLSQWVAVMGGLFLIWMGWGMVRDVFTGRVSLPPTDGNPAAGHLGRKGSGSEDHLPHSIKFRLVATGVLTSLANPYWILWWATVGLGYLTVATRSGMPGLASFFTGHILSDIVWYIMIGFLVAKGRKLFNDTVYKGVLSVCGFFLFGIAGYFVYYGVLSILGK